MQRTEIGYNFNPSINQFVKARVIGGIVNENGMRFTDFVAADTLNCLRLQHFGHYLFASSSLKQCSDSSPVESKIQRDTKSP